MKLWRIELNNGDWFLWFATAKSLAVHGMWNMHYADGLDWSEFLIEYGPRTKQVDDGEIIEATDFNGTNKTQTAAKWCEGKTNGPFLSNTYEV